MRIRPPTLHRTSLDFLESKGYSPTVPRYSVSTLSFGPRARIQRAKVSL